MNALLVKVKEKNNNTFKNQSPLLRNISGLMVLFAIFLLVTDLDTYISYGVLLIFFALILLMIYAFIKAIYTVSKRQMMIKHSIDIAYQSYVDALNIENSQAYVFETESFELKPWILLPSFVSKDVTYCLNDHDKTKLFFAQAFTVLGTPPRRTYYFDGLYIIIEGVHGDLQYRDKESISGKIVTALSPLYEKDTHELGIYKEKRPYKTGTLYQHTQHQMPDFVIELIESVSKKEFVDRLSIAIKNNDMHIAIELKSKKISFVKTYKETELKEIKQYVDEKVALLNEIKDIVVLMQKS